MQNLLGEFLTGEISIPLGELYQLLMSSNSVVGIDSIATPEHLWLTDVTFKNLCYNNNAMHTTTDTGAGVLLRLSKPMVVPKVIKEYGYSAGYAELEPEEIEPDADLKYKHCANNQ